MNNLQEIANFICSIADEVLRDDFKRGPRRWPSSRWSASEIVPLPPVAEHPALCAYIDAWAAALDATVYKIREQIGQLHPYRVALISAAVRGKIDVRESAEV